MRRAVSISIFLRERQKSRMSPFFAVEIFLSCLFHVRALASRVHTSMTDMPGELWRRKMNEFSRFLSLRHFPETRMMMSRTFTTSTTLFDESTITMFDISIQSKQNTNVIRNTITCFDGSWIPISIHLLFRILLPSQMKWVLCGFRLLSFRIPASDGNSFRRFTKFIVNLIWMSNGCPITYTPFRSIYI